MTDTLSSSSDADQDDLVRRARDLFEFLIALQRQKTRPVRTVSDYARQPDGQVTWWEKIPDHAAVTILPEPTSETIPLIIVDRLGDLIPPEPPALLADRLSNYTDPGQPPTLPSTASEHDLQLFEAWLITWQDWADQERAARVVRDFYKTVYATMLTSKTRSEEIELILGLGCLSWQAPGGEPIQRHALTVPVHIDYDDATGQLRIAVDDASVPLALEVEEFVEPGQIAYTEGLVHVKTDVAEYADSPVDPEAIGALLNRLANSIRHDAIHDDTLTPFPASPIPRIAWAPALITRKRSTAGMTQIFQTVVEHITDSGTVPAGLMSLIDVSRQLPTEPDQTPGAAVRVGSGDVLMPLPLNDKQLEVLQRIDSTAHTVVQGPPGTGKTHTIAAVLSHLLAQGKRVLVTAHTDRALEEVRDKLPEPIKPLSVSVIGTSRDDMSDLKLAVATIAGRSEQHDPAALTRNLARHKEEIDRLSRDRALAHRELIDARGMEVKRWTVGRRAGTLAELSREHNHLQAVHGWLQPIAPTPPDDVHLTNAEAAEWLTLARDETLDREQAAAEQRLIETPVPDATSFAALCHAEAEARRTVEGLGVGRWTESLEGCSSTDLAGLGAALEALITDHDTACSTPSHWAARAITDILSGQYRLWSEKLAQLLELQPAAVAAVNEVGASAEIIITHDPTVIEPLATALHQRLLTHGDLKVGPDGMPRTGFFAPRVVKSAGPVFGGVRIDGLPPTSRQGVGRLLAHFRAERVLRQMDAEWQGLTQVPPAELGTGRRLRWHQGELEMLRRVVNLADRLAQASSLVQQLRLPQPDWRNLSGPRELKAAIDAVPVYVALRRASDQLADIDSALAAVDVWADASPCITEARDAVTRRDPSAYAAALDRNATLTRIAAALDRRRDLRHKLSSIASALPTTIESSLNDPVWDIRLGALDEAIEWARFERWLRDRSNDDMAAVQDRLDVIDSALTTTISRLAADRAWGHALSPERIDQGMRLDLHTYVQLVRRLGKGTGKHAPQRRAEIRKVMNRCRSAIPVWIMPLYRIAEQLQPEENSFDVVIVDEASQASVEAVFLQYFAPKLVVVGDDRQVSPAGVGVDQQEIRDLAQRHMPDNPYRNASWSDPLRSLFDEATARYRGKITLTEHRRCVPEIIGFSNQIAYEPDGVPLDPVRQVGSSRLPPIRTVFIPDGYRTSRNVNRPEAIAIVDQIEACIADPAYEGRTMGVISLIGHDQARVIEDLLLERLPVEEISARDIRCGDATAFQGSERDVIFLSLVATVEPDKRSVSLTTTSATQRFNVAASRAKDQMWLFHSVRLEDLHNTDDLKYKLLKYCLTTAERGREGSRIPQLVPHDVRVPGFDSLFEQRIFNHLAERGYDVRSQVEALGYRIDLVVRGASRQIAIECDGDHWHGPEAYERDLARQRDLERCGWQFLRIRESTYYREPGETIAHLVEALTDRDIHPVDHPTSVEPGSSAVTTVAPRRPDASDEQNEPEECVVGPGAADD